MYFTIAHSNTEYHMQVGNIPVYTTSGGSVEVTSRMVSSAIYEVFNINDRGFPIILIGT